MRRIGFALLLTAGLSLPSAVRAADNTVLGVGTGAVAGAVVGGPIGAVVGAVAGGFIGANTRSTRPRAYRRTRLHRRAAARPGPARARVADGSSPARTTPASEVTTQARALPGAAGPAPSGWRDPR